MECCDVLNKVIDPVRKTMPPGASWPELIEKCYDNGVHLSATSMYVLYHTIFAFTEVKHCSIYLS